MSNKSKELLQAALKQNNGFSMELKGEAAMVGELVPNYAEMGTLGGDPKFPRQIAYTPDEMVAILKGLAADMGDGEGGDCGYSLAGDILSVLGVGDVEAETILDDLGGEGEEA